MAEQMSQKAKVIIRRAEEYDPAAIGQIIREGIEELGLAPKIKGKIFAEKYSHGSLNLDEIEISGDISLAGVQERTKT